MAALRDEYEKLMLDDTAGAALLRAFEAKNSALLINSNKDVDLLKGVYGDDISSVIERKAKL